MPDGYMPALEMYELKMTVYPPGFSSFFLSFIYVFMPREKLTPGAPTLMHPACFLGTSRLRETFRGNDFDIPSLFLGYFQGEKGLPGKV